MSLKSYMTLKYSHSRRPLCLFVPPRGGELRNRGWGVSLYW